MGFQKWLLTYGLGSPGHTARSIVRGVHNIMASQFNFNEDENDEDLLYTIYYQRLLVQKKLGNKSCLLEDFSDSIKPIIDLGDIPLFIFAIETLESKSFRSAISNNNLDLVLEVIREEVMKLDDTLVKLDHFTFRRSAIHFFNMVLSCKT